MARSMTFLLFLVPAIAIADDDPIKTMLDKARVSYTESCDAAMAKFVAAMEAKLKEVSGKGDLDGALQVKAQKETFENDGTLPKSSRLARTVADYQSKLRAAKDDLRKAIKKAKDSFTKELKLDEAQSLETELKELSAVAKTRASDPNDEMNKLFAEGSVWKGIVKEKKGASDLTADIVLALTKREGAEFEGTYQVWDRKFIYLIEGSIAKERVSFKITKVQQPNDVNLRNLVGLEHKGRIIFDPKTKKPTLVTHYTWRNSLNTGLDAEGTATLVFVAEE